MARKNESIFDILILLPWWVSMLLSIISYLILKYFIPSIDFQQKGPADLTYGIYKGLANAAPMFAPIVSLFLLIPAAISAINSKRKRQSTCSISSRISSKPLPRSFNQPPIKHESTITSRKTNIINETNVNNSPNNNYLLESNENIYSIDNHIFSERINKSIYLSIETLKTIEWFSFELFCKIYYELIGYKVTKTNAGADGGIDLLLYLNDSEVPYALVQCKSRAHRDIGVNYIRELLGVMASEKVNKGILITNSGFTKEAFEFANAHHIDPVDVSKLWVMLDELDAVKKSHLIDFLESSDFTTPTCPNCEVKLVERIAKKGKDIGQKFWGCKNYPRCHYKLRMK